MITSERGTAVALRVLAAALHALPRQIHANAGTVATTAAVTTTAAIAGTAAAAAHRDAGGGDNQRIHTAAGDNQRNQDARADGRCTAGAGGWQGRDTSAARSEHADGRWLAVPPNPKPNPKPKPNPNPSPNPNPNPNQVLLLPPGSLTVLQGEVARVRVKVMIRSP